MYQVLQYIKFLFKASNQHGVHSPFIYRLITEGLYQKIEDSILKKLFNYKLQLQKNSTRLEVNDHGAGSKRMATSKRSIAQIAKISGSSRKKIALLYRLSNYFQPEKILELGTSLGIGTYALHQGCRQSHITTIEGASEIASFTKGNFRNRAIDKVEFINNTFDDALKTLENQSFDLIFFDGHHTYEATLNYANKLLQTHSNNSVWIFDDIYWSKEMTLAWKVIKEIPEVTVTVDLFYFGLVFFRQEQAKEHFKIRV
ncbi:MAG: O-methyltransferase [bacterium]